MTKTEFYKQLAEKYGEQFVEEYKGEVCRRKLLDKINAGDPAAWDDVQNLYDKYCYFEAGFDAVAIKL